MPLAAANPLRVVIPIVAGIGNALLAVPMVRQLRRNRPETHITILARLPAMGEIFQRLEEVDEVRPLGRGNVGMLRTMLKVRRALPDVFLIPFPSNRWQYMMLALASGAGRRVLHRYPVGYVRALGFVPARRVTAVRGQHDVNQNLMLLRELGIEPQLDERPIFPLNDEDRRRGIELIESTGLSGEARPIAIHPGSAQTVLAQAKRWPPQRYAQLITQLRERFGDRIIVLEGPDEAGVSGEIAAHLPGQALRSVRLCGPLGEAAALLERAEFYVGSDSGLAHLAAAVGTPPVTLFAPADPDRVCPFGHRHLVVQPPVSCSPCLQYPWQSCRPKVRCRPPMCIEKIEVGTVMDVVAREVRMKKDD
jgi:ADP-heptose:LPS heptosyltransferase